MRQIPYGSSSAALRFDFPAEWDGSAISALTLTVKNSAGTSLLSAQSVTLYTATSLDGAVDRYASSITLDSGAGNLSIGDSILIVGTEGAEVAKVKGFDSTNKIAELEGILENEYADNDSVYGLWGNYSLDVSTTATYTKGLVCTLLWTPTGTGQPVTELAQIAATSLDIQGLEKRFSRLYPRAYEAFTIPVNRFSDMLLEAEEQLGIEMLSVGCDIQRIVDQNIVAPALMAKMAFLWTINGDENKLDEREFLGAEYAKQFGYLQGLPIWTDDDQDLIEDEGEVTSHEPIFDRGW